MPIVKNPRLRQIIIDNLLRSVRRRTAEEIREEVEVQMGTKVSIETIYGDLRTIKDENQLDGQELIVKDKNSKLYYQDKNFSIQDAPLSDEDMEMLDLASMIFRTFKTSHLL
jgi:Fe2+ or Zn2+ uptake regulation protein